MKEPKPFNQEVIICMSDIYDIVFIRHTYKGKESWYKLNKEEDIWAEMPTLEVKKDIAQFITVRGRIIMDCASPYKLDVNDEIGKLSEKEYNAVKHIVSTKYPLPVMSKNSLGNAYICRIIPYLEERPIVE